VGALPVDRQTAAMAQAAVAAEVHQALHVHLHFAAQIALDLVVGLEKLADLLDLTLGELFGHPVGRNPGLRADGARRRLADPVEVRERVDDVLVTGEVDACDASHVFLSLTLALLVAGVLADDPHDALAADHLALVTDLLDARTDFHRALLTCGGT
jgi:hypothetical protein